MTFNELVKQWNGKWGIPNPTNQNSEGLKGQCVSLARYYIRNVLEIPLDGISGDAKDYWYRRNQSPLNKYFDAIPYTNGMSFQAGDIFILGPVTDNPYGHIGICTGNRTKNTFEIFDSNHLNKRTCELRYREFDGILGILRPKDFLQSKIDCNVEQGEPVKWIEPYPTIKIDKATTKDGYPVRIDPMSKETVYHAKTGDYLTVLEISSRPLDDGFKWAKVLTYGGTEGYIQIDLDYMHVEV